MPAPNRNHNAEPARLSPDHTTRHIRTPSVNGFAPKSQLVPLRLGPIVLRDDPDANREAIAPPIKQRPRSDSTQELLQDTHRRSYLETRETPFQRCSRLSINASSTSQAPASEISPEPVDIVRPHTTTSQNAAQASVLGTMHQSLEADKPAQMTVPATRSRARLQRKRSDQSAKKSQTSLRDTSVEREIFELKSIVRDRRAGDRRADELDHHVPAVAPAMQVRARSETLDDIGSAFSRPLTSRGQPRLRNGQTARQSSTQGGASLDNARCGSRVSGWLSNIMPSSSSSNTVQTGEPFYKCVPSSRSVQSRRTSPCSSRTEVESPGLTLATSPTATSNAHSRTLTAESQITGLSPVDGAYDALDDVQSNKGNWSSAFDKNDQVGLAL